MFLNIPEAAYEGFVNNLPLINNLRDDVIILRDKPEGHAMTGEALQADIVGFNLLADADPNTFGKIKELIYGEKGNQYVLKTDFQKILGILRKNGITTRQHIYDKLIQIKKENETKINAKYDAELSVLEQKQAQEAQETQKQIQEPTPEFPITKNGEPDFNAFTPQHFFNYTSQTEGVETAISDIKSEKNKIEKKIAANNKKINNASLKDKVKLRAENAKLATEVKELDNIIENNRPKAQLPEYAPDEHIPQVNEDTFEKKKKRAIREGGQVLISNHVRQQSYSDLPDNSEKRIDGEVGQVLITDESGQPSEISALPGNSTDVKDSAENLNNQTKQEKKQRQVGNLDSQSETMNPSTPVDKLKTVSSASEMQNRKSVSDNTLRSSALTDKQEDPNGTVSNTDTKDNNEKTQNQKSNKRKYNSLDRVTINGEEHVISEAGSYVGTNDHFYTLEKDGQTVYEDISQEELEQLISSTPPVETLHATSQTDATSQTKSTTQPEQETKSEEQQKFDAIVAEGLGVVESRSEVNKMTQKNAIRKSDYTDRETGVKYPYQIYSYLKYDSGSEYLNLHGNYVSLEDAQATLNDKENKKPVRYYHGKNYDGVAKSTLSIAVKKGELDSKYNWEWHPYPRNNKKGFAIGRLKTDNQQQTKSDTTPVVSDTTPVKDTTYDNAQTVYTKENTPEYFAIGDRIFKNENMIPGIKYIPTPSGENLVNSEKETNRELVKGLKYNGDATASEAINLYNKLKEIEIGEKSPQEQVIIAAINDLKIPIEEFLKKIQNQGKIQRMPTYLGGGIKEYTKYVREYLSQIPKLNDNISDKQIEHWFNLQVIFNAKQQSIDNIGNSVDFKQVESAIKFLTTETKESTEKFQDFGEKIGGARKDMNITRTARGTDNLPAWRRKYSFTNNKPGNVMEITKKFDPQQPFYIQYTIETTNWRGQKVTSYRPVNEYVDGKTQPKLFTSEQEAENYIPIFEVQLQGYRVRKKSDNEYVIAKTSSIGKAMIFDSFETKEEAEVFISSTEGATSLLNRKRENFSIPALENVERTGKDYRKGKDITTDEFMNTFGFRGGEFGNWVKTEERQVMLNMAYDSLMDLADILNIPPKAISLNSELAIAFGARGFKAAAAHFEPLRAVINLTRMNGAGSLAHEWAHALDNYFGLQDAGKDYTKDEKGEVEAGRMYFTERELRRTKMRPELKQKFDAIVKALKKRDATKEEAIEIHQKTYENQKKRLQSESERIAKIFEDGTKRYKYNRKTKKRELIEVKATPQQLKKVKELLQTIVDGKGTAPIWSFLAKNGKASMTYVYQSPELFKLDDLHREIFGSSGLPLKAGVLHNIGYYGSRMYEQKQNLDEVKNSGNVSVKVDTDYFKVSKEFDASRAAPYFSKDVEMFARALEYYVQTNLEERGIKSDYLQYDKSPVYDEVYGKSPYPLDTDRARLNTLFKEFFDEVKTRTDEAGNVAMFQSSGQFSEATPQKLQQLLNLLKKTGLANDVKTGQAFWDKLNSLTGDEVFEATQKRLSQLEKAATFIRDGLKNNVRGKSFTLPLPESTRRKIMAVMGRDFDSHNITINSVVHALKEHGEKGRKNTDTSIPITAENTELIPYIMTAPDYVKKGSISADGRESVRFYKNLSNGYVIVAEKEQKNSPNDMDTITMWAELSSNVSDARTNIRPLNSTSQPVNAHASSGTNTRTVIISTDDTAKIKKDAETAIENDEKTRFHAVWHGSPHAFKKFSLSKIGTGEGVQAYGYGLYFTDKENIARSYAKDLSGTSIKHLSIKGLPLYKNGDVVDYNYRKTGEHIANLQEQLLLQEQLFKQDISVDELLKEVQNFFDQEIKYIEQDAETDDYYKGYLDVLKKYRPQKASDIKLDIEKNRNLYKVKIHGDKTIEDLNFIRWDKPLTESQKELIAKQAEAEGYGDYKLSYRDDAGNLVLNTGGETTGEFYYKRELSRVLGSEKDASEFLLRAGIDGIQYPTEFQTKGEHEEAFNYVVFDENALEIEEHIQFLKRPDGTVYGFVDSDNVIYLNPDEINLNTPIHEYGHLWVSHIKENYTDLYKRAKEVFTHSPYMQEVKADPNYSHLNEEQQLDEAIARAIGDKGESVLKSGKAGMFVRIKNWISDVWKRIGAAFGIQNLTPEQIGTLTWQDITDMGTSELLSGEKLTGYQHLSNLLNQADQEKKITNPDGATIKSEYIAEKIEKAYGSEQKQTEAIQSTLMEIDRRGVRESNPTGNESIGNDQRRTEYGTGLGHLLRDNKETTRQPRHPRRTVRNDFAESGYVDVIGRKVESVEDIAEYAKEVDAYNEREGVRFKVKSPSRSDGWYKAAEAISEKQNEKAKEVLSALRDAGFDDLHISRSITDFGVSTYIQGQYGLKFRISDHSVTNIDRVLNEIHFGRETSVSSLVEEAKEVRERYQKIEKARTEAWEADKERRRLADEKWERIKHYFDGMVFKRNERTYQNFETFRQKGSEPRSNILQKVLGKAYEQSAFAYEWTEPTEYNKWGHPTNYGQSKPSVDYIEAFDEVSAEVQTTRFKVRDTDKMPARKMNQGEYQRLIDAYDNVKTLDEKHTVAETIIRQLERVLGDNWSNVAKTHEDVIRLTAGLTEKEKTAIRNGEISGLFDGKTVHIDVQATDSASELIGTWFHENGHRIIDKLFTTQQIEDLLSKVSGRFEYMDEYLPESYRDKSKRLQGEEIIVRTIETIVEFHSLEDIVNNNIDYDGIPERLRNFVEPIFDELYNERKTKEIQNGNKQGNTRASGLPAHDSDGNARTRQSDSRPNSGIPERGGRNGDFERQARGYNAGSTARVSGAAEVTLPPTITIAGVERSTTNSEGNQIHPTEEGVRNFWKWFGDSKVVDAEGRPLVVYHGTGSQSITVFEESFDGGQWFSDNKDIADDFAKYNAGKSTIYPVYINLQNPYINNLKGNYIDNSKELHDVVKYLDLYDGIILKNAVDGIDNTTPSTIINTFNPNQIKSIDNTGEFDATNNDIRFRVAPTPNIQSIKSLTPDYNGFLNAALHSFPDAVRGKIYDKARQVGFDKINTLIEQELADTSNPDRLDAIRQLLLNQQPTAPVSQSPGHLSDPQLRYLLWLNANPNDGTPEWKAKDALKKDELDANKLFKQGKAPSKIAMNEYERRVRNRESGWYKSLLYGFEEGWLDRMASLRYLQDAISGNNPIPDKANAYNLENQLSSRNTAEIQMYDKKYISPLIESIGKIFGNNLEAADNYFNAKHGLERNEKMAREEADKWKERAMFDLLKKELDDAEYDKAVERIEERAELKYKENLEKDYSGLTALAAERLGVNIEEIEDFKSVAQEIVKEVEDAADKADIDALWQSMNAATKWMLDKQYDSGMMSKDVYEHIKGMYEYYVPLRGFAETKATDLYEYLINPPSDFQGVLKTAKGRTSKAESPTATILNMAESGIMQANRNKMKQAFYRLVATNPSSLASIEDVWHVKSGSDWMERFPDIPDNATGDEVADAIAEFNQEMAELAAKGEAVQGRNKLDIGVRILKAQAAEHAVRVWIGGEEKVIYINGNPRAAQAINGLTNSRSDKKSNSVKGAQFWMRQMSANFTSRNPAFMVTNFMRDIQFALISATVREGGKYSGSLAINAMKVPKTIAQNIWGDGNAKNTEYQQYWEEFLEYGGETGYANIHSVDYHRKYINKELRKFDNQRDFIKPFRAYAEQVSNANRLIEDISRFATYVTSRQAGRNITRSVQDSKEITINFNRKGSGIFGADIVHGFYLFANPAIQSLRLMGLMAKNHRIKFTAMLSTMMATGFMVPMVNEILLGLFGDDDDKEAYWNISDWTRRNNLVLYAPWTKDKFVTIMLSHELRSFYGMGEIAYSWWQGRMRHQNPVLESAKQLSNMLPIDPMGGKNWAVPDIAKPIWESYVTNTNFMDRPIYKDNPWNKRDPQWAKAFKSTPDVLVEATKWLNEQSGGDDVVGGKLDLNPARMYHLTRGYLGGAYTTYIDLASVALNLLTGREVSNNDIPVANKLIRTSDEKTEEMRLNSEYFYYLDWMKDYEHKQKGYEKRIPDVKYRKKYLDLIRNEARYRYVKNATSMIKELSDSNPEKATEKKREFLEEMRKREDAQ